MLIPTIHTNGTSRDDLVDQQTTAGSALRRALECMQAAAPNGRDFYPQGDGALKLAQAEHGARIERVRSVLREVEQIAEAIADGRWTASFPFAMCDAERGDVRERIKGVMVSNSSCCMDDENDREELATALIKELT